MVTTIVAICPYCRSGGVRAVASAEGSTATCPRCRSNFTLVADPTAAQLAARQTAEAVAVADPPPDLETAPPLCAGLRLPEPEPVAEAVPTSPRQSEAFQAVALVSLCLVGPTIFSSRLPYGRAIGLLLNGCGILSGLVGLIGRGKVRFLASVAVLTHLAILSILLLRPLWLGFETWHGTAPQPRSTTVQALRHGEVEPRTAAEILDGSRESWLLGDVRVSVHRVWVGPAELTDAKGGKRRSRDACLQVSVRVTNSGVERRIPLDGWAAGEPNAGVRLLDAADKEIKPKAFPADLTPVRDATPAAELSPKKSSLTLLIFELPPGKRGDLRLELPGAAVGADRPIRFRLPAAFVSDRP